MLGPMLISHRASTIPCDPHVDDLVAVSGALDAAPAHLVGHSWRGFIALLTAIRRPDLVRSLILMEPPVLSLFVSTLPRPSEVLRVFFWRPRLAAAIVKFGVTVVAPAQKAFRRATMKRPWGRSAGVFSATSTLSGSRQCESSKCAITSQQIVRNCLERSFRR
jgi:pimeloyl-ACP methyl ester carboxylesterase